ncbi:MAG: CaiB/BaiF CoA transferase family protein [Dehalococcoidia bacterium]
MLPLDHIRVLDLTRLAPGPHCTMILADLGADVIRIEEPGGGRRASVEQSRMSDAERVAQRRLAAFNALDRNKRSITLNLKVSEARQAFHDLARGADVVVEGFRPGVAQRLGVDYDTLAAINPRIIYCSISGYGQDGPYRLVVGHDINYVAMSGALSMIGDADGPPAIPANLLGDYAGGGMHAAVGILTALVARERTGRGQFIDIAMTEGVMTLAASALSQTLATHEPVLRGRNRLTGAVPHYQVYRCKDSNYVAVGANEPWFFENLCRELGGEEFAGDQAATGERREQMFAFFRDAFAQRTRDEWWELLREKDVCVAPVYTLAEAAEDSHLRARGMIVDLPHEEFGAVQQVGISVKLSDTPGAIRHPAHDRGADTEAVLREAGWNTEQIAALSAAGGTDAGRGDG